MYNFLTAIWLSTAKFGPLLWEQPHKPLHFRREGHREPPSGVRSLSLAERLLGFEPGTFLFLLQRFNPLGHSPQVPFGHPHKNFASKSKFQFNPN